jgi:PHS family inorganic phosphate transporter-like MFS transporter
VEQTGYRERREVRKETWGEFWRGFRVFLFTERKWRDRHIRDGHWMEGSWTDLAGTSLTWMLLDFSFYFLGLYDPTIISILWESPKSTVVYPMLMRYGWHALISNTIGAFIGAAIFIVMARYRYQLQLYGFLILAVLFVVVGVTFLTLSNSRYFAATIVFYGWVRLFFNLGKVPDLGNCIS